MSQLLLSQRLLLFGKIFQGVYGSIFLFWYFNLSFPFVYIFIIVILFCGCLQILVSFYCYLKIFQVIIDRPVFVLPNVSCYIIEAFIIQFVVSKMTVMYPSCQSFKCFFVKILFVNIRMVDTFFNKYFNFFCRAYFIAVKYWNMTDDGTSFLSIILRKVSMVAFLLLRICSSVLCLFHGLCMMSIPCA